MKSRAWIVVLAIIAVAVIIAAVVVTLYTPASACSDSIDCIPKTPEPPTPTVTATSTTTPQPPTVTPTPTPTEAMTLTPTPTPTPTSVWDKSSIAVGGKCEDFQARYEICNGGADMAGTARWHFLSAPGGAAECANNVLGGSTLSGAFQLKAGTCVELAFDIDEGMQPPFDLCVQQRDGHPGTGWAHASAEPTDECKRPTALDEAAEPATASWTFLPLAGK